MVGTMLYACPEVVQNKSYTYGADIWSLGCLLYQMAALTAPFAGRSLLHVVQKIVECDYVRLQNATAAAAAAAAAAISLFVPCPVVQRLMLKR